MKTISGPKLLLNRIRSDPYLLPVCALVVALAVSMQVELVQADCINTAVGEADAPSVDIGAPWGLALHPVTRMLFVSSFTMDVIVGRTALGQALRVAGVPTAKRHCGDNLPATAVCLNSPRGMAWAPDGALVFCDGWNHRVRRLDLQTSLVSTIAGDGAARYGGDGLPATRASMNEPCSVAFDPAGNMFITEQAAIRRVDARTGVISTVVGTGVAAFSADGLPATSMTINTPRHVIVLPGGDLLFAEAPSDRVRRLDVASGLVITIAGGNSVGGRRSCGDGAPATLACLYEPTSVAVTPSGDILIAEFAGGRVRFVSGVHGNISTLAGHGQDVPCPSDAPAGQTCVSPAMLVLDNDGTLYISEFVAHRIRMLRHGMLSTIMMGSGAAMPTADGAPGLESRAVAPYGIAIDDDSGDIIYSEMTFSRVRRLRASDGTVQPVAGTGFPGYTGDGQLAQSSQLLAPAGVAVHPKTRDVLFADRDNKRIFRVDAKTGLLRTHVGNCTIAGRPHALPAVAVCLAGPTNVAVSIAGDVVLADPAAAEVYSVNASTGIITIIAGGTTSTCLPLSPVFKAQDVCVRGPRGVAVAATGDVYIAETGQNRIVVIQNGIMRVFAGSSVGQSGRDGNGGPATSAKLASPYDVAVAPDGSILIAEITNDWVRRVLPNGTIVALAGIGLRRYSGDGGPATAAGVGAPVSVAADAFGNAFFGEANTNRIRVVQLVDRIACAPGYMCPCAQRVPCANASSFCPGSGTAALAAMMGYFTLPETTDALRTQQVPCPVGSFCVDGIRFPCPTGTVNPTMLATDATACSACPIGTYLPTLGSASITSCAPCPWGSTADAMGTPACTWCAAGTEFDGQACSRCPNGTSSLGAGGRCQALPQMVRIVTWTSHAAIQVVEVQAKVRAASVQDTAAAVAPVVAPIVAIAAVPLLLLLLVRCTGRTWGCRKWCRDRLRAVDGFALLHDVDAGRSPVKLPTSYGGACTILAFGVIIALCAMRVLQYTENRVERSDAVMMPVDDTYADLQQACAVDGSVWSAEAPACGVRLVVHTMGIGCEAISWSTQHLLGNADFEHRATFNETTAHAQHVFDCETCAFTALSAIEVTLPAHCYGMRVHGYAVNSDGVITAAAYAPEVDATRATAAVAFTLMLDKRSDAGGSHRGFTIWPSALPLPAGGGTSTFKLVVALPLQPTIISKVDQPAMTFSDLTSSMLACTGLVGIFGWVYVTTKQYIGPWWRRRRPGTRNSLPPWVPVHLAARPSLAREMPTLVTGASGAEQLAPTANPMLCASPTARNTQAEPADLADATADKVLEAAARADDNPQHDPQTSQRARPSFAGVAAAVVLMTRRRASQARHSLTSTWR